jgi:hypothetical protein
VTLISMLRVSSSSESHESWPCDPEPLSGVAPHLPVNPADFSIVVSAGASQPLAHALAS